MADAAFTPTDSPVLCSVCVRARLCHLPSPSPSPSPSTSPISISHTLSASLLYSPAHHTQSQSQLYRRVPSTTPAILITKVCVLLSNTLPPQPPTAPLDSPTQTQISPKPQTLSAATRLEAISKHSPLRPNLSLPSHRCISNRRGYAGSLDRLRRYRIHPVHAYSLHCQLIKSNRRPSPTPPAHTLLSRTQLFLLPLLCARIILTIIGLSSASKTRHIHSQPTHSILFPQLGPLSPEREAQHPEHRLTNPHLHLQLHQHQHQHNATRLPLLIPLPPLPAIRLPAASEAQLFHFLT